MLDSGSIMSTMGAHTNLPDSDALLFMKNVFKVVQPLEM